MPHQRAAEWRARLLGIRRQPILEINIMKNNHLKKKLCANSNKKRIIFLGNFSFLYQEMVCKFSGHYVFINSTEFRFKREKAQKL